MRKCAFCSRNDFSDLLKLLNHVAKEHRDEIDRIYTEEERDDESS